MMIVDYAAFKFMHMSPTVSPTVKYDWTVDSIYSWHVRYFCSFCPLLPGSSAPVVIPATQMSFLQSNTIDRRNEEITMTSCGGEQPVVTGQIGWRSTSAFPVTSSSTVRTVPNLPQTVLT